MDVGVGYTKVYAKAKQKREPIQLHWLFKWLFLPDLEPNIAWIVGNEWLLDINMIHSRPWMDSVWNSMGGAKKKSLHLFQKFPNHQDFSIAFFWKFFPIRLGKAMVDLGLGNGTTPASE